MSLTTTGGSSILSPDQVAALVVQPLIAQSVATQASTVIQTASHQLRIPVVTDDPSAAWVAEGAEITADDPTLDEVDVTPSKLAGLVVVSNELVADSSRAALQVVGDGLVRSLRRKLDAAFFANAVSNGPSGLGSITSTAVDAGASWSNLDAFATAKSKVEGKHSQVTSFVTNETTALALAKLKDETNSNRPLLGNDPTLPGARQILGVPLLVSPEVDDDTVWCIPRQHSIVVIREGAQVVTDTSAYFSSDRVGVRATMRVGFAFTYEAAVAKITLSTSG